uniref:(northern house mosquito) hypothetical protein n=1 Tax=Culex pipiens TaxID=7175 RepID=A0A8D8FU94_CULPI
MNCIFSMSRKSKITSIVTTNDVALPLQELFTFLRSPNWRRGRSPSQGQLLSTGVHRRDGTHTGVTCAGVSARFGFSCNTDLLGTYGASWILDRILWLTNTVTEPRVRYSTHGC